LSELLIGLEEIARYLRISVGSLKQKSAELQQAGLLFKMWRGRPPKLRTCAFTNHLQAWLISDNQQNDLEQK
jgi:hypothetical protein